MHILREDSVLLVLDKASYFHESRIVSTEAPELCLYPVTRASPRPEQVTGVDWECWRDAAAKV